VAQGKLDRENPYARRQMKKARELHKALGEPQKKLTKKWVFAKHSGKSRIAQSVEAIRRGIRSTKTKSTALKRASKNIKRKEDEPNRPDKLWVLKISENQPLGREVFTDTNQKDNPGGKE